MPLQSWSSYCHRQPQCLLKLRERWHTDLAYVERLRHTLGSCSVSWYGRTLQVLTLNNRGTFIASGATASRYLLRLDREIGLPITFRFVSTTKSIAQILWYKSCLRSACYTLPKELASIVRCAVFTCWPTQAKVETMFLHNKAPCRTTLLWFSAFLNLILDRSSCGTVAKSILPPGDLDIRCQLICLFSAQMAHTDCAQTLHRFVNYNETNRI